MQNKSGLTETFKDSRDNAAGPPQDSDRDWRLDLLGVLNCFLHYPGVIEVRRMLDAFFVKSLPDSYIFDSLILADQCSRREQNSNMFELTDLSILK